VTLEEIGSLLRITREAGAQLKEKALARAAPRVAGRALESFLS